MNSKNEILVIENLAAFEKIIYKDDKPYDINMMVMPGHIQDKHKNIDPETGIPPLRRKFNVIYLMLDGVHDVCMGTDHHWLKPNDLVIVPENMVYASKKVRECTGYCIHFKTEFIQPLLSGPLTEQFSFFDFEAQHIINVTDGESEIIQKAFQEIINEYHQFSYEKEDVLRNLVHILLLRIREIYRPHVRKLNEKASRKVRLCNHFKHLVERNIPEIREVSTYADMMNITPQYLSDVVKCVLGKSPRKLINDMLTLESKVLLGSTDKSISEIAYLLRFEDQAHFSNFIKIQTGSSPSILRKKL